jgi:type IV pilus assembly protein PilA
VLQLMRRRLQGEREGGFTLIELMVVVLIIAILIAIAIPTFLGARTRAQNRAVQSNLRNALTVEKSVYTDAQAYSGDVTAAGPLKTGEPSLTFRASAAMTAATVVPGDVYVYVPAVPNTVVLGTKSASGTCYYVKDVATQVAGGTAPGTYYLQNTTCGAPSAVVAAVNQARWT